MADTNDPNIPEDFDSDALQRPYAEEAPEIEQEDLPRRAASARFIVDSEVGSEALLRDAMDPANQSLADALRLSFRVLQAVIVVLIVLFLASGLKTVDDGYSGVRTLWGRIVEPLSPGPKFSKTRSFQMTGEAALPQICSHLPKSRRHSSLPWRS